MIHIPFEQEALFRVFGRIEKVPAGLLAQSPRDSAAHRRERRQWYPPVGAGIVLPPSGGAEQSTNRFSQPSGACVGSVRELAQT